MLTMLVAEGDSKTTAVSDCEATIVKKMRFECTVVFFFLSGRKFTKVDADKSTEVVSKTSLTFTDSFFLDDFCVSTLFLHSLYRSTNCENDNKQHCVSNKIEMYGLKSLLSPHRRHGKPIFRDHGTTDVNAKYHLVLGNARDWPA